MVFKLKSMPPEGDFVWNRRLYHLTYEGHLPVDLILSTVAGATSVPVVGYSICHEQGEEPEDDGSMDANAVPYDHTHVGIIFKHRINLVGSRKFDILVVHTAGVAIHHPNVAARVTMNHMEELITQYHRGRKYNIKKGKTEFKAPILHEYKLPQDFCFGHEVIADILDAKDLPDACLAGNVRPRTVSDIKVLRDHAAKRPKAWNHLYPRDSFFALLCASQWNSLWMYGDSNTGKTKWALNQFDQPFLVKPFNSVGHLEKLKAFDPSFHTGIVFDEADLTFLSREDTIALLDFDEEATLHVRFTSVSLPAGVKKIFCSNPSPASLLPHDNGFGAIARRLTIYGPVRTPTYRTPTPTASPPVNQLLPATPITQVPDHTANTPLPAAVVPAALQFSP